MKKMKKIVLILLIVSCNIQTSEQEKKIVKETEVFYKDGTIQSRIFSLNEVKDSVLTYYPSGSIESIEMKIQGKKYGCSKYYFKNGLASGYFYFFNDIKQGPYETYYENGQLRSKGKSLNGIAEEWVLYSRTGELLEKKSN